MLVNISYDRKSTFSLRLDPSFWFTTVSLICKNIDNYGWSLIVFSVTMLCHIDECQITWLCWYPFLFNKICLLQMKSPYTLQQTSSTEYAKFVWASPDSVSGDPPVLRRTFWILAGHVSVRCPANIKLFAGHFVRQGQTPLPDIFKIRRTCPASPANFAYPGSNVLFFMLFIIIHYK